MAVSNEYAELSVDIIYYDKAFNCRGVFTPQSCLDIAQSIRQHGLQFPVVVQPAEDVEGGIPESYDYRLIVGHRRFTAVTQLLGEDTIAVQIRKGLTEKQVRVLNLIENLERKNISLLDEGKAIHAIFSEGITYAEMAKETSKSTHWCRIRWMIPTLSEEIQQDCAAGRLGATDIALILTADDEQQLATAHEIKLAKGRGESVRTRARNLGGSKRIRGCWQIREMLAHLMSRHIEPSPYRALAWAAGDLTDAEFLEDIRNAQNMG